VGGIMRLSFRMRFPPCLRPAKRGFAQAGATARKRGNLTGLLHGVYPEQNNEILRFTQNDKKRRVRNDASLWQLIYDAHLL